MLEFEFELVCYAKNLKFELHYKFFSKYFSNNSIHLCPMTGNTLLEKNMN